jgi:hypothetical protein
MDADLWRNDLESEDGSAEAKISSMSSFIPDDRETNEP